VITDTLTGRTDGLLARCLAAGNCPKIIKTDSEIEFYQQRASLVATDTQGNALAMPDNVRLFLISNLQHFALANDRSALPRTCMFPTNPLHAGPPARALLVALDAWITDQSPQRRTAPDVAASRIRLAFAAACPEADLFRCLPGALLPLGP
jgi:Alpha/beta hydrolase domain